MLRDPALFVGEAALDKEATARLLCNVCKLVLYEPANLTCGHSSCRACLVGKSVCPECPAPLFAPASSSLSINYALHHAASRHLRKCPYTTSGCTVEPADLATMQKHVEQDCTYALCECRACNTILARSEAEAHVRYTCLLRLVKCGACEQFFKAAEIEAHRRTSPLPLFPSPQNAAEHISEARKRQKLSANGASSTDEAKSTESAVEDEIKVKVEPMETDDDDDDKASAARGCDRMMVCDASCIDPKTGRAWVMSRAASVVHKEHTCTFHQVHCSACCTEPPAVVANSKLPASCAAHTFSSAAYSEHLGNVKVLDKHIRGLQKKHNGLASWAQQLHKLLNNNNNNNKDKQTRSLIGTPLDVHVPPPQLGSSTTAAIHAIHLVSLGALFQYSSANIKSDVRHLQLTNGDSARIYFFRPALEDVVEMWIDVEHWNVALALAGRWQPEDGKVALFPVMLTKTFGAQLGAPAVRPSGRGVRDGMCLYWHGTMDELAHWHNGAYQVGVFQMPAAGTPLLSSEAALASLAGFYAAASMGGSAAVMSSPAPAKLVKSRKRSAPSATAAAPKLSATLQVTAPVATTTAAPSLPIPTATATVSAAASASSLQA
jgi:hypothetical protein